MPPVEHPVTSTTRDIMLQRRRVVGQSVVSAKQVGLVSGAS